MTAEAGASSVTMRAIGDRLGVSRAAAYRHFADKPELLAAVAAAGFTRLAARVRAAASARPRSGLAGFRRMGDEYVRFALDNPAHYRLMYGEAALSRSDFPELRAAADALFALLVDALREHQRAGLIKRQAPEAQAYVAWSAMHGLAALMIDGQIQAADDVDGLIRQTTRTLLNGMRAT